MSKKWETITFGQIKKGDRIKATRTVEDMIIVYRGTANHMNDGVSWVTKCGWFIAGQGYKIKRRVVKPPKPEPLPTKPGSLILAYEILGETFDPPRVLYRHIGIWSPIDGKYPHGYALNAVTKWEHASVIPTSTLYK